jgi:hypothetical protein
MAEETPTRSVWTHFFVGLWEMWRIPIHSQNESQTGTSHRKVLCGGYKITLWHGHQRPPWLWRPSDGPCQGSFMLESCKEWCLSTFVNLIISIAVLNTRKQKFWFAWSPCLYHFITENKCSLLVALLGLMTIYSFVITLCQNTKLF